MSKLLAELEFGLEPWHPHKNGGVVAHACNLSTMGKGQGDPRDLQV